MAKAAGEWYSILLASDDKEKIEVNGPMRLFVESMQVLDNSSLYFRFHTKVDGECMPLDFVCDKVPSKNGLYHTNYEGENMFQVLDTNYESFIIFHLINLNKGTVFQIMELYGRRPDVSKKIKKKFMEACKQNGIPEKNVIDLTRVDRCLQERGVEEV
ncbi:salivary lipocalin-like [Echinops telfairi]|uniref:Salivary lipocalin-like n=1 Tax=Echinops telfairi TaxID=9371 RepID=A0ABM0ZSH5_ECHTE|nr:salivary lipocalin-like [Echinops telfairi]